HTHMSLFSGGANIFFDAKAQWQLSQVCLNYIGGILRHAKGFCAITNPLVNSYKRLVPGYEAPTAISWSEKNRSPLVRVPATLGDHLFEHFVAAKREEWFDYIKHVSPWETDRYLRTY